VNALGSDGMPSIFYKKLWSLVGERVKQVHATLNGGPMYSWNDTIIVLIPKTN
jgi:hypothetical protein